MRSLFIPALAALALGGGSAHAEDASKTGILITVQPSGAANAAFVPLRRCGAGAALALRLGEVRVDVPPDALHHVVFAEGSGKRNPVERAFPEDAGCAESPLAVRSALLTSPMVVVLLDPEAAFEPGDRAVREAAAGGSCSVTDGLRRCVATTDGRTDLSLTLADPAAPIEALCTGRAGAEPQCRILGQAPNGPAYGVPIADGLVNERSLGVILAQARDALRTLLRPAAGKTDAL